MVDGITSVNNNNKQMKTYAVSLDLTVTAENEEQAHAYANAIAEHIDFAIAECKECTERFEKCSSECGNVSPVDEVCLRCGETGGKHSDDACEPANN